MHGLLWMEVALFVGPVLLEDPQSALEAAQVGVRVVRMHASWSVRVQRLAARPHTAHHVWLRDVDSHVCPARQHGDPFAISAATARLHVASALAPSLLIRMDPIIMCANAQLFRLLRGKQTLLCAACFYCCYCRRFDGMLHLCQLTHGPCSRPRDAARRISACLYLSRFDLLFGLSDLRQALRGARDESKGWQCAKGRVTRCRIGTMHHLVEFDALRAEVVPLLKK